MSQDIEEIINKVFEECGKGRIRIGDPDYGFWTFYTKFFYKCGNQNNITNSYYPIVDIPNKKKFIKEIEEYLFHAERFYYKDKEFFCLNNDSFKEKLIHDLFLNATTYDFSNIIEFIKTRKRLIQEELTMGGFILGKFDNYIIQGRINKNPSNLEGPYNFHIIMVDEFDNQFVLPSITFGIADETAYIYAVQNKKGKQSNPLAKKLDRLFRKVNKDVDSEDVIANVSPNALVSLTIFNSFLINNNITQIIAPDFMPLRYHANKIAKYHRTVKEAHDKVLEKHNHDQYNITNKFMYLLMRYAHHFDNTEIYYDENRNIMQMQLSNKQSENTDNLIYTIDKSILPKATLKSMDNYFSH